MHLLFGFFNQAIPFSIQLCVVVGVSSSYVGWEKQKIKWFIDALKSGWKSNEHTLLWFIISIVGPFKPIQKPNKWNK